MTVFLGRILEPLGIATLTLVVTTVALGLSMPKNRQVLFKWHRRAAFTALFLGLIHGTLVFLFH